MTLIVCVDNNMGVAFNHRRQSRDSRIIDDIVAEASGGCIEMDRYSEPLFSKTDANVKLVSSPSGSTKLFFAERTVPLEHRDAIDKVILYRFNRSYPADTFFELPLDEFELIKSEEFSGSSHEKITKEVYLR